MPESESAAPRDRLGTAASPVQPGVTRPRRRCIAPHQSLWSQPRGSRPVAPCRPCSCRQWRQPRRRQRRAARAQRRGAARATRARQRAARARRCAASARRRAARARRHRPPLRAAERAPQCNGGVAPRAPSTRARGTARPAASEDGTSPTTEGAAPRLRVRRARRRRHGWRQSGGRRRRSSSTSAWSERAWRRARRRGCVVARMRIALGRSRGAAFFLPGIYTSTATFFRLCVRGCSARQSVCVHLARVCACCLCVPSTGALVRGYVSAYDAPTLEPASRHTRGRVGALRGRHTATT